MRPLMWVLIALLCAVGSAVVVQRRAEAYLVENEVEAVRDAVDERLRTFDAALKRAEGSALRLAALVSCNPCERPTSDTFDRVMTHDPDGLYRSDKATFNAQIDAGVWMPGSVGGDPIERGFFQRAQTVTTAYGQGAASAFFADSWVLPLTNGEVIYFPQAPGFIYNTDPTLDYRATEWVQLTNPAANPDGRARWTSTSFDPAAKSWMISVVAPFHRDGRWAGSVGHDVLLPQLFSALLGSERDGRSAPVLVARADGQVLFQIGHTPDEGARVPERFARLLADDARPDTGPSRVVPERGDDFALVAALPTLQAHVIYLVAGTHIREALRLELVDLQLALALAIAVSLAVALLFVLRDARHRRDRDALQEDRNRALQAMVDERTAALTAANAQLETLSLTDPLTGLANRRAYATALDQAWRRGCRTQSPVSLLMVDVDDFKRLNDSLGHPVGDRYLQKVGALVAAAAGRAFDTAARYGGEEFVLILPETDTTGALGVAERLRRAVEAEDLPHPSVPTGHVTVSVGVATAMPEAGERPESLVVRADRALYSAKAAGRNRCEVAPFEGDVTDPPVPGRRFASR